LARLRGAAAGGAMHAGRQFLGRPCVKKSSNPRLSRNRRRISVRSYSCFAVDVANRTHFLRRASGWAWRAPHRERLQRFPIETRRPRVRPSPDVEAYRLLSQV